MFKEAGLSIMLIIYLMAVYTLCGVVGLALHFPFRNCELEGSIVDVGVLKQAQLTGNNNYYKDVLSGNFYPIITYSNIKNENNISYSFNKGKMKYKGVISYHKLYTEDGRTWTDAILQYLSSVVNGVIDIIKNITGIITTYIQIAKVAVCSALNDYFHMGIDIDNPDPGMEYLEDISKPGYANPKFEFCYATPQAILVDEYLDDADLGDFYIICTTNYIKADTG